MATSGVAGSNGFISHAVTAATSTAGSAFFGRGASPVVKLAMLSQLIQGLAQQFPQGQQGIQMMLKGLQMIQSSASASSAPQQAPAPPR